MNSDYTEFSTNCSTQLPINNRIKSKFALPQSTPRPSHKTDSR